MEAKKKSQANEKKEEERAALLEIWKYAFAFQPLAVLKCAIELQISETVERHGGSIALPDLSTALRCSPSALHRIMRYLIHHGFFQQTPTIPHQESSLCYTQTPLSRLLSKDGMAPFILLQSSPAELVSWHGLSRRVSANGVDSAARGGDAWERAAADPDHNKLINDAMASHARFAMSAIIDQHPEVFQGITSLVDVGGGDGTALRTLVKACPWVRGVNYDRPQVVSVAPLCHGVDQVGGDMFEMVPKGDAVFLMWVLHNWSDEECIRILRNCMGVIPKNKGKVIIVEAVVKEGEGEDEFSKIHLALDMVMIAHMEKGKERTFKEWEYLLNEAGFTKYTVKDSWNIVSVIEAYP
ncbi:flavonoid 4'-O-methyltransferase 3-like [Henckelia pumila]|uniref:flavonoid 4'-O-methyltransferase 3-like n=1 Tax=Henckelia pumila TaxID=405737 RepID=UPI003C6E23C2